ncbi:Hypothetical predicted protein [Drosophila guanche]|uniref:Uncharacterized protein n=1 Tax=Drosophila guanche TaxID=7266 RepID=A0A3B0JR91_DROGU|nr:Hypothetical predicted protein [Drosophila guanche]
MCPTIVNAGTLIGRLMEKHRADGSAEAVSFAVTSIRRIGVRIRTLTTRQGCCFRVAFVRFGPVPRCSQNFGSCGMAIYARIRRIQRDSR